MIGKTAAVTRASGIQPGVLDSYDILILDAAYKQSLVSAQSLGRAGLRVALAESYAEYDPSLPSVLAIRPATWSCRTTPPTQSRSRPRS